MRKIILQRAALVALALVATSVAPAAAQGIYGQVVDDASGAPLEGARVVLLDAEERTVEETFSDSEGYFRLDVPRRGSWVVAADLIGYGSVASAPIAAAPGERIEVAIHLTVEAVAVDETVVVTGRMTSMNADLQAFYNRMDRGERSGIGDFLGRDQIDRLRPLEPSDLMRSMTGVRVVRGSRGKGKGLRMGGGECVPAIFIDGTQINRSNINDSVDDFVAAQAIEGIEVYRGPQQVGRFHDFRGCGLVLVWTRRGVPDVEGDGGWMRLAVGAALILSIFLMK